MLSKVNMFEIWERRQVLESLLKSITTGILLTAKNGVAYMSLESLNYESSFMFFHSLIILNKLYLL